MALTKIDDRGLKTPIDLLDNEKIRFGTGNDLEAYHSSSDNNSYIQHTQNGTSLIVKSDYFIVAENQSTDIVIRAAAGVAELYYNNFKTFNTKSNGIVLTGPESTDCNIDMYADDGDDNADHWRLVANVNGQFGLYNYASGAYEKSIFCGGNGNVELYYDNVKAIETTNPSAVRGVKISNSIEIYRSDYGNGNIRNTVGDLYIEPTSGESGAKFTANGNVELYYDNSKKFETTSGGGTLTGDWTVTGNLYGQGHITVQDSDGASDMLKIGADEDLRIYHYNNTTYIRQHTDKVLKIGGTSTGQTLYLEPKDGEVAGQFTPNGAVKLYYDNSKKFETTSTGVQISGNDLTITDAGDVNLNLNADSDNTDESHVPTINFTNDSNQLCLKIGIEGSAGDTLTGTAANTPYISGANGHGGVDLDFGAFNAIRMKLTSSALRPIANDTYDLGSSSYRWRNVYTGDLNLSNEGSSNDIDSTWGDWTIQEGESDLFLKNNRSGKKYKFNLTEVS